MDKVLILDFGSQVTQLIARRIRKKNIYCEIYPFNISEKQIRNFSPKALILSGGPASTTIKKPLKPNDLIYSLNIPILGICYGHQLICQHLGGSVIKSQKREFGKASIRIKKNSKIFDGIYKKNNEYQVWMSHGDKISKLPKSFHVIASTSNAKFAAIANENKKIYGLQFHPEVIHTLYGDKILENFVKKISLCKSNWKILDFIKNSLSKIKEEVKDQNVICALSGGVDSSVTAALLHKSIGKQLKCVFVDTGLLRKKEGDEIEKIFKKKLGNNFKRINADKLFLNKLKNVIDPEKKRKVIGKLFIDIFSREAKKYKSIKYLAQGTLYPDVIESKSVRGAPSAKIKSHHNVGGLPKKLNFKLIEPLKELFKDEVRVLGKKLNIPDYVLKRHPFPGPGLAVRIPGNITKEKIKILQDADSIFIEQLKEKKLYDKIWQAFTVLIPVKTIGVMGDQRSYEYTCALRAVTSLDGMTAEPYYFNANDLAQISTKIVNEVKGINRVVYDYTSKPPGTIEWE